jgi:hypothetical protein
MKGHLIRKKDSIAGIDREIGYKIVKYQNNVQINMLLNYLIINKKKIFFNKLEEDVFIKILDSDYREVIVVDNGKIDSYIAAFIRLLKDVEMISGEISYSDDGYQILIVANEYKYIFDNYLLKRDGKYIYNLAMDENIRESILKYNKLVKVSLGEFVEDKVVASLDEIRESYEEDKNSKLIINDRDDEIDLLIKGKKNIRFRFLNKDFFFKLYLPEILKLYVKKINEISKEQYDVQFNKCFVNINDNLYFLKMERTLIDSSIEFVKNLLERKNYQREVSREYIRENEDISIDKNREISYSYGYINILLIAFILSVLTIVFCLFRY